MSVASVLNTRIVKHQKWNAKVMGAIWEKRGELDEGQLANIKGLYDNAKRHNRMNVSTFTYGYSKKTPMSRGGYGRIYGIEKGSMERVEKTLRHSLCAGIYWDIDMVNAQPTILSQMAGLRKVSAKWLKYYVENREMLLCDLSKRMGMTRGDVKEWVIKCLFGCKIPELRSLQKEMQELSLELRNEYGELYDMIKAEKEKNLVGAFLAYVAQTEECKCLRAMDDYFTKNKREVGVLNYDGCMVYVSENESEFPVALLRGCEKYIKDTCGYEISLIVKDMKCSPDFMSEKAKILRCSEVDDVYMTNQFIEKMNGRLVHDSDYGIMVYDEETGLWTSDENILRREIVDAKLVVETMDGIVNYSGFLYKQKNVMEQLPSLLSASNFFEETIDKSIGKLLFKDGIYDMRTREFTEGFDKNLVFSGRISRKFPRERDEKMIEEMNTLLFKDPFYETEHDVGIYLKQLLARGIAGEYRDKVSIWAIGETNSGKGVQTIALMKCFESFISTYNPNALLYNKNSGADEAKKLSWVYPIHNSRISIGNEVRPNGIIDSSVAKQITSGGDPVKLRKNFKDEEDRYVRATIMYLCNDMAKFDTIDDGLAGRIQLYEYKLSFVNKSSELLQPWERPAKSIKGLFDLDEYKNAYFWCIMDAYVDYKPNVPRAALASAELWIPKPKASFQNCLRDAGFEIVKGDNDIFTPFSVLKASLVEGGVARGMTDQAIGRELNKLGLLSDVIRIDGRTTNVRRGITRN